MNHEVILKTPFEQNIIALRDMPLCSYGVIVESKNPNDVGLIMCRCSSDLFVSPSGTYWNVNFPKVKVRVLQPGESFEVFIK